MTDIDFEKLSGFVVKFQQGDEGAFEQIYNMTYRTAKFTALKILNNNESDADDVLQDCYIKIMSKIGTLKDPSSFMSWFNMIVANQAKSVIRKNNPHFYEKDKEDDYSRYDDEWAKEYTDYDDADKDSYSGDYIGESKKQEFIDEASSESYESFLPESSVEQEELCETVMEMIDSLSDEKKTAVVLYYYNNMTTKEIAETVGVSENTIKSRLVQAKKDISKAVSAYESKHGKLLAVSPASLITWVLKSSAASTSITPFAASGIAAAGTAATAATVTAGSAAGASVATKVIAGVVIAGVVAGGGVAGTRVVRNHRAEKETTTTAIVENYTEPTTAEIAEQTVESTTERESIIPTRPREEYTVPEGKNLQVYRASGDLRYGVKYSAQKYASKDGSLYSARPALDRTNFHATYDEMLPYANENSKKFSAYINDSVSEINKKRTASGLKALTVDSKLTEQANVRAEEIAWTDLDSALRKDNTSYTTFFDRNGFKTGSRKEIRKVNFSSYESAIESILKSEEVKGDFEKIGVGVAINPENEKYVFVVHLYTNEKGKSDESISSSDILIQDIDKQYDNDVNGINKIYNFSQNIVEIGSRIPVIKDILEWDPDFLNELSLLRSKIIDAILNWLENIEEGIS